MKIKWKLPLLLAAVCGLAWSAGAMAAGQPSVQTAAKQAGPAADFRIAERLTAADLHGLWVFASENEEGTLLNMSAIRADGSGSDIMILADEQKKPLLKIRQTFRWQFDENKQQFSQWVTDYAVQAKDKPYQRQADEIGKRSIAAVSALAVKGKIDMLEFRSLDNDGKAVYFRADEARLRGLPKE